MPISYTTCDAIKIYHQAVDTAIDPDGEVIRNRRTSRGQHDSHPDVDLGVESKNHFWADRHETLLHPLHLPKNFHAV